MQENEYKQYYKVLIINGLHKFFNKYKPTI